MSLAERADAFFELPALPLFTAARWALNLTDDQLARWLDVLR